MHICHHCGKPTNGANVLMPGQTVVTNIKMCQECWDYIGSKAAALPGATMKNRIEMEKKLKESKNG